MIKYNAQYGLNRELDLQALELLQTHPFPGNVRELLNRLQQAVLLSEGPGLGAFLRRTLAKGGAPPPGAPGPAPAEEQSGSEHPSRLAAELAQVEKKGLLAALKYCGSTRAMAALLGISQAGVSRKLRKYGLQPPQLHSGRPKGRARRNKS